MHKVLYLNKECDCEERKLVASDEVTPDGCNSIRCVNRYYYDDILIGNSHLSYLQGKILTQIESLGLNDKQEEAFKSIFKDIFWNTIHDNCSRIKRDEGDNESSN